MSKVIESMVASCLAMAAMAENNRHNGVICDHQYTQGGTPGQPGHGRSSVNRPKKAKTHGKNKRKRK